MTHFSDFENSNVIFFDGYCFLCNRIVDFLISKDRNQLLQFASIQSEFASNMFSSQQMFILEDQKLSTVVFLQKGKIKTKSEAVIAIISTFGGVYRLANVFHLIPRSFRDFLYMFVANRRYRWFGKRDFCRMPTDEDLGRLIR